jgi:hypothetical protein
MQLKESKILEKAVESLNAQIDPDKIAVVDIGINDVHVDAIVRIKGIDFVCEIKGNITNANVNNVLLQLLELKKTHNKPVLLVAKYIYPELMNELANQNVNILDSAGNCIIRQNNLLLIIKGQKNTLIKEAADRAFQETGIKLIFYFLMHPESVNLSYRSI